METQRGSSSASAQGLSDRLKQDGRQQLESRKRSAADQISEVASALGRAGEELDQSQPALATYANQIASRVGNLATRLRDGSVEQLVDDTRQIARRNPGLFILGGVAIGVALARFLKASQPPTRDSDFSSSGFAKATSAQKRSPTRAYSAISTNEQSYPVGGGV